MISTAIDPSAVARVVGIKTDYVNLRGKAPYLPQRIALIGQGNIGEVYSTVKRQVTSAQEVGTLYGFGSPLHLAAKMLFPTNGDGVGTIPVTVYPLESIAGAVKHEIKITPTGTVDKAGTFYYNIGGIRTPSFTIEVGDTGLDLGTKLSSALAGRPELPVRVISSGVVDGSTRWGVNWSGLSAANVPVEIVGPTDTGLTFTITRTAGTNGYADIAPTLAQIGGVWETVIINCEGRGTDNAILEAIQAWGEGRWNPMIYKPAVSFTGVAAADHLDAVGVTNTRPTDRVNCILPVPGSNSLPFRWAADAAGRIARMANSNPAQDYAGVKLPSILPGTDALQYTYLQRDILVKDGSSTTEVRDGVVTLSDTVTCYHPSGDPLPAYRYVVDIMKLMQVIYNLSLIFNAPDWQGAPLIPDSQPTVNPRAKQPKAAVAAVCSMIDSLALDAILSDPAAAKKATMAGINSTNPKRLDVATTVQLSGNTNIISVDLNFGFYFGGV